MELRKGKGEGKKEKEKKTKKLTGDWMAFWGFLTASDEAQQVPYWIGQQYIQYL